MKGAPEFQDAFNLMLCLYSLGDKVRMKDCFTTLLTIEIPGFTEEEEEEMNKTENKYTVNILPPTPLLLTPSYPNKIP